MNILFVYADPPEDWNSSEYRCRIPCDAINKHTQHKALMVCVRDLEKIIRISPWADAFIMERNYFGEIPNLLRYLHQLYPTKAYIATFDDGYHHITRDNPGYLFWKMRKVRMADGSMIKVDFDPLKVFVETLRLFDCAFVPNKLLASDYAPYTKTIYFPNYQDSGEYLDVPKIRNDGKLVIGWGAGGSHVRSLVRSGILDVLYQLMKEYPQIELWARAAGNIPPELKKRLNMKRVQIHTEWLPKRDWVSVLANFDIGMGLLAGDEGFDARRSWVKISEFMLTRVPFVASNAAPYEDYAEYGYLANGQMEWYQKLKDIIENRQNYVDTYIEKAYQFALSEDIKQQVQSQYIDRIQAILEEKGHEYVKIEQAPNEPIQP